MMIFTVELLDSYTKRQGSITHNLAKTKYTYENGGNC